MGSGGQYVECYECPVRAPSTGWSIGIEMKLEIYLWASYFKVGQKF